VMTWAELPQSLKERLEANATVSLS
jgi:hypothetical protein